MLVSVYRYNPETDTKPHMQDFEVDVPTGKDLMVLDVLNIIKEQGSGAGLSPLMPRGRVRV